MRVAIIGSRDYPVRHLPKVSLLVASLPEDAAIVSGGAAGVDTQAERAARAFGRKFDEIPVDTTGLPEDEEHRRREFGKRAFARNTRIVESADLVVAFWTHCSRPACRKGPKPHMSHGTAHAISEAHRLERPTRLFGPDGKERA